MKALFPLKKSTKMLMKLYQNYDTNKFHQMISVVQRLYKEKQNE